jgi:hypothetical protein
VPILCEQTHLHCYKCGIIFSVPDRWYDHRCEDHRPFFCPNGHRQHMSPEEPPDTVKRSELIQAMHRAEQAEAKAAELSGQHDDTGEPQPKCRKRSKA